MVEKKEEGEGTGIEFDHHYRKTHRNLADLYFDGNGQAAGIFALAIGIKLNLRSPRKDWKNTGKGNPHNPFYLHQLEEFGKFGVLFESLGMVKDKHNTKKTFDEFLTGGLSFIESNMMDEEGNLQELKDVMPELFSDD
jgi:hypothetical protein